MNLQWRFNGTNIAGATTNFYSITNVQATNAGNYSLVVSDFSGSITSAVATLTVTGIPLPPTITRQPQGRVVYPGSNATFIVSATGTAPFNYQWRFKRHKYLRRDASQLYASKCAVRRSWKLFRRCDQLCWQRDQFGGHAFVRFCGGF
ncbi:MAG: immunoglobulin domain-containing protein [Limisphaerales bacterium]